MEMLYVAMGDDTRVQGRVLGLDVGKKTIGLALYTPVTDTVTPLHTVKRLKWADDAAALRAVVTDYDVQTIVLGYPLETDGTEGVRCQSVRAFMRSLEQEKLVGTIILQDERYSTKASEEALVALDLSRKKRREVGDAVAAQVILQNYLGG